MNLLSNLFYKQVAEMDLKNRDVIIYLHLYYRRPYIYMGGRCNVKHIL